METLLEIGLANAAAAAVLALAVVALASAWRRPALVHAFWLVVLLKLVTPPLVTVAVPGVTSGPASSAGAASAGARAPRERERPREHAGERDRPRERIRQPDPPLPEPEAIADTGPAGPTFDAASSWDLRRTALFLWLSGSAVILAVALRRALALRSLLSSAQTAPDAVRALAGELAGRLRLSRAPAVLMLAAPIPPTLFAAWGRPRVLLPAELWRRLDDDERRALLLHELAHLRRRDHWVRWLELVTTVLYWWHPAVWWARREIRRSEEVCCDAWVVWAFPERARSYGDAILETVDFLSASRRPRALLGSAVSGFKTIERRLTMIMRGKTPRSVSMPGLMGLAAIAAVALPFAPVRSQAPPVEEPAADEGALAGLAPGDESTEELRRKLEEVEKKLDRVLEELESRRGDGATSSDDQIRYKGKSLDEWVLDLGDRDSGVHNVAVSALREVGADASPYILRALGSTDWLRRSNAATAALFRWRTEMTREEVEALLALFRDPDDRVREHVAEAFRGQGAVVAAEALPVLIDALEDERPEVRQAAARALGIQARYAAGFPDGTVATKSAWDALRPAVPALVARIEDGEVSVRIQAAWALRWFGSIGTGAVPALDAALGDSDDDLAVNAAIALVELGTSDSERLARRLAGFLSDEDSSVRRLSAQSLRKMGPAARPAIPDLVEALEDEEKEVRHWSATALAAAGVGDEELLVHRIVAILSEAVGSGNPDIRLAAIESLGDLGPAAASAAEKLEAISGASDQRAGPSPATRRVTSARSRSRRPRGPSEEERVKAAEALKKIRGESER